MRISVSPAVCPTFSYLGRSLLHGSPVVRVQLMIGIREKRWLRLVFQVFQDARHSLVSLKNGHCRGLCSVLDKNIVPCRRPEQ